MSFPTKGVINMDTIYTAKALAETIAVRTGPGLNYSIIDSTVYHRGTKFYITKTEIDGNRVWGFDGNGWVCLINGKTRNVDYRPYEKPIKMSRAQTTNTINADSGISTYAVGDPAETPTVAVESQPATAETFQSVFNSIMSEVTNNGEALQKNMRLFGLPYQFRKEIDVRVDEVSTEIGRKFIENIVTVAPVVTIIPGQAKYLPGTKNKEGWTHAFMAAATGNFAEVQQLLGDTSAEVRYYDFEQTYTEYINYVNIMCRTAATFLELTEEIDGTPLQSYDWKNYRWNGQNYKSISGKLFQAAGQASASVINGMVNKVKEFGADAVNAVTNVVNTVTGSNYEFLYTTSNATEEEQKLTDSILQSSNFVQFYIDPDTGTGESASNSTSESKIKGMLDSGSDMLKELAFITNSGGIDSAQDFSNFVGSSLNALSDQLTAGGNISTFLKRFLDLGGNIMKGENIIMPDIYNSSSYERSFSITVHLKAPYGNRFSYYMDVLVPMFHLLALALPKQTSANSYGAPFLIKAYCEGTFTCNLGIVSSISISKNVSPESWTNDGFPSEVDVTLQITDLYSDLTMSPAKAPLMFLSNSSLIEYLATTCGLSLIQPQLNTRLNYTIAAIKNAFGDIDQNVISEVTNTIDNLISPWLSIS